MFERLTDTRGTVRVKRHWFPEPIRRFGVRLRALTILLLIVLPILEVVGMYNDHTLMSRQKRAFSRYTHRKEKEAKLNEIELRFGDTARAFVEGGMSVQETGTYLAKSTRDFCGFASAVFKKR